MILNLPINPQTNPDIVGEHLRHLFFKQDRVGPDYSFGCYSTFELREGIVELPKRPVPEWDCDNEPNAFMKADESCENHFTCAELQTSSGKIIMLYYWQGDGTLSFILPDGSYLINSDCKKDYGWKLVDSFEEYWRTNL